MTDSYLRACVNISNGVDRSKSYVEQKLTEERGEVGSWLIMAAGLAAGAVAAVAILEGWFEDKAKEIKKEGK